MGSLLRTLQSWFQPPAQEVAVPGVPRRASLGLQQLVPVLRESQHAGVVDLGCVWQSTVSFFTGIGCKIYTEDLFAALQQALAEKKPEASPLAPVGLEQRFLASALQYPEGTFRGILVWDLFDYLPQELVGPLAARLHRLLEPGGALLALFHNRPEKVQFNRYRVVEASTLELLPGSLPLRVQRTFSNRALLDLFAPFSTSRTFIGRDNLRELFLLK